jgi:virulence-associated protein VapD
MRIKRRLEAVEFISVRHLLNISDDRINAARCVLVDGKTYQAVADQFGWSRQAVGDSVNIVWRTFLKLREAQNAMAITTDVPLPPGWELVELAAPSNMINEFRKKVAKAYKDLQQVK